MQDLGYNYRITDLQSALGRSQLKRLPEFIARRQQIASRYNKALANLDWLKTPSFDRAFSPTTRYPLPVASAASNTLDPRLSTLDSSFSYQLSDISLHLYTVQIDFPRLGKTRTEVMQELRGKGVGTQVLYIPVYLQPWYRRTYGYALGKCPNAEQFYTRALSLPLYPTMKENDINKVIQSVLDLKRCSSF